MINSDDCVFQKQNVVIVLRYLTKGKLLNVLEDTWLFEVPEAM